jgi:hypothetical protein
LVRVRYLINLLVLKDPDAINHVVDGVLLNIDDSLEEADFILCIFQEDDAVRIPVRVLLHLVDLVLEATDTAADAVDAGSLERLVVLHVWHSEFGSFSKVFCMTVFNKKLLKLLIFYRGSILK